MSDIAPPAAFPIDTARLPRPGNTQRLEVGRARWRELSEELRQNGDAGLAARAESVIATPGRAGLLDAIFAHSPFLTHCALREPAFLADLLDAGPDESFTGLIAETAAAAAEERDQARLMSLLRIAKRKAALLIALADLAGAWDLEKITDALTRTAETGLDLSMAFLLKEAAARGEIELPFPDEPLRDSGLVAIGMGKLGARELNYSSDIDIIVLYDSEKMRYRGGATLGEAMVKLTKQLVRMMDERTADGYVFRTDLRLRPDPGSTPVAMSVLAAETYYEAFGQNWERAAMIKARAVAGDRPVGELFLKNLRPYIWRKHLDFAAIQDIHSIKRQINAHRGGSRIAVGGHNIKLGRGGIREIEFFAQTQQLIWGGRVPALRSSRTLEALAALAETGRIEGNAARELTAAYIYLRTLEHRLQMVDDKQTQTLPGDPEKLRELADFMGTDGGVEAFHAELLGVLQTVEGHYAHLFEDAPALSSSAGNLVFTGGENDPETLKTIAAMGFANADAICSTIRGWHHGRTRATRSTRAREMLTELTPALLEALAKTSLPDAAFLRFDEFLKRMPAGVPLFSLLYANPGLLGFIALIMGNAPRLAETLSRHPALLDHVLAEGFFDPLPAADELANDLEQAIAAAHSGGEDFEEVLSIAQRWTNDRRFQVGAQILHGRLDPADAGRSFTAVAEALILRLFAAVLADFERVHGKIPGAAAAVMALGKMGSREMTATSDLDLILVYDMPGGTEASEGPKPLAPSVYYGRLTQRLVNALTASTADGRLYEVDMRLRPSGRAGPLAVSLESFALYQQTEAWTWEHMALTRARVVAGAPELARKIETVIRQTLRRLRDPDKLVFDVADMRLRMAKEHKGQSPWDIKYRRGGLVDIEFLAQYLQLRYAPERADLLTPNTDQTLARAIAAGLLPAEDGASVREALRLWAALQNVLRVTIEGNFSEESASPGLKKLMAEGAGAIDFADLRRHMDECAERVFAVFRKWVAEPGEANRPAEEERK